MSRDIEARSAARWALVYALMALVALVLALLDVDAVLDAQATRIEALERTQVRLCNLPGVVCIETRGRP